jgi:hypothetical protein
LPCFVIGKNAALIPAFGSFTALGTVQPEPGDRVFVIAGDEVLEVAAPVDLDPTAFPTALHELSSTESQP